jgi:hypothetical protein
MSARTSRRPAGHLPDSTQLQDEPLVLDDADKAGVNVLGALADLTHVLSTLALLVLATGEDARALACLGDRVLNLRALDEQAVRAIAVVYAPSHATADVPTKWLVDVSGGVPAHVHEAARQWARRDAAHRVKTGAERAATTRAELRSIESALASNVVELQAARDRDAADGEHTTRVVCPFKGLAAFDVVDAPYFFGRERLVGELLARLVGSEDRRQIVIRPGEHPRSELRDAIDTNRDAPGLLLFVDQFEETFTACHDPAERAAFIADLVAAATNRDRRCVIVLAIRSDSYGRCAAYPALASLLAANHVLVAACASSRRSCMPSPPTSETSPERCPCCQARCLSFGSVATDATCDTPLTCRAAACAER